MLDPGTGPVLVARYTPGEAIRVGFEDWTDPPAEALLVHWPGARFRWTPAAYRFSRDVQEQGGALFPLSTILQRLGVRAGRGPGGLTAALLPDWEDAEDPESLGGALVVALAERLADPAAQAAPAVVRPVPAIQVALESLPAAPGTYRFLDSGNRPLYIGKARNLAVRAAQHFLPEAPEPQKQAALLARAVHLDWRECGSELEALLQEYLRIRDEAPALNVQIEVHTRPRRTRTDAVRLLLLPSVDPRAVDVCLVARDGRFHWETAPRRSRVPRSLQGNLSRFLKGQTGGAPSRLKDRPLSAEERAALAAITWSWVARHGDRVTQLDPAGETGLRPILGRLRVLLSADPTGERIEVR